MDAKEPWEDFPLSPDLEITVGDSVIKCHKPILGFRSPVFKTMFETKMAESDTNKLTIKEIDEKAFLIFLRYLYSPEKKIHFEDLSMELLNIANMYTVDSIVEVFNDNFEAFVNVDNVIECAILTSQHESRHKSSWRYKLVNFIARYYQKFKKHENFQRLKHEINFMIDLFDRMNLDSKEGLSAPSYNKLNDVRYSMKTFSPEEISFDLCWNLKYYFSEDFLSLCIKFRGTIHSNAVIVIKVKITISYDVESADYVFEELLTFSKIKEKRVHIALKSDFDENSSMVIRTEIYDWYIDK